jgi:diguanylate cyclase (GGDEF)-like protein
MTALKRFLGGLEEPRSRVVRGGRIAAVAFIVGGLVAIPANVLIEPRHDWVYLMPLLSLGPGLVCLFLPWERMPEWVIRVLATVSTALVSFSMAVASPAYAAYYVFVVLFVALVFPRLRVVVFHLLLVCVGLFVPVFVGEFTGRESLIVALLEAPSLFVVGMITSYLTVRLEESREALYRLSRRDELTGVGNYRSLHESVEAEIARHGRSERSFALILVDLDGFKAVNDRVGHLGGDRILAEVGTALRDGVRAGDMVFRQGGDEFAVLAPESGIAEAEELTVRLRALLGRCGEPRHPVTAGTGFAVYPADGLTVDDLLSFADVHLLACKQEQRAEARDRES